LSDHERSRRYRPGGREIADQPGTFTDEFEVLPLREAPLPAHLAATLRANGVPLDDFRYFAFGDVSCFVSREPAGKDGELLWHMSVSHPERHPTWDEIKFLRYRLLPADLCFGILLPPSKLYVNVPSQDHVFHVWEVTDPREPWSGL
jgi:hypothetical protein